MAYWYHSHSDEFFDALLKNLVRSAGPLGPPQHTTDYAATF